MSVGRLRIIKSQLNLVYKKATTLMTLENKAINQKYIFVISHRNEGADINYKWVIPTPHEKSKMRQ